MLKNCFIGLCCTLLIFPSVVGFGKRLKLGGLFEEDGPSQKAFVASINAVNKLKQDSDEFANVFLVPDVRAVTGDVFDTWESACAIVKKGPAAVFGPTEKISGEHVQSMCSSMDMPHFVARWEIEPGRIGAFNLYPHAETLAMVFFHLVIEFEWKSYTIIYDTSDGMVRTNQLLKRWNPKGYPVTVRNLGEGPNYREVLLDVKDSQEENLVIDVSYEILDEVLKQCLQVGLISDEHNIIVTNLDLQTLDLEPYQYSGANFTGVRLVRSDDPETQSTFDDYLFELELESLTQLTVEAALTFDSVQLFARAFKRFRDVIDGDVQKLACDGLDSWNLGESLKNYIRMTEMRGLTGLVKFETNGYRSDFELDILQLELDGLEKVGTYNSTSGIDWISEESFDSISDNDDISNKTFRVLIALSPPYNMRKESAELQVGNDRYEGFGIEIIQELKNLLHFNYTFIEAAADYGSKGKDGKWTGMLGAIIADEADLAITDLTITSDRESAVDFSMPFLNLGISILYRKPTTAPPSLFAFLAPFSIQVWIYLIATLVVCSLVLFVIGRMSPAEWNNPYPCIEEPEELENQFTLKNSFWFTIGAIMQQGSEIAPIGMSTRMLGASWWFFCLIIVSSYTANLAAFLVVETIVKPIQSAEDLANKEGEIKYGAKRGGSTYNFFQASDHSVYMKMFKYMEANADEVLTESNDEGRDRVLDVNQDYAFLMESSSIQYIEQRQCNVTQIGSLLDAKGYGIAMRKNWKYRNKINTAVLTLQETGLLSQLQKKWWEEKRGGGKCKETGGSAGASPLTMEHVGGVFLVLGIGMAFSIPFTFFEFIWDVAVYTRREKMSFREQFMKEFKFIMKCKGEEKEARKRKASSQTTEPSTRDNSPPYGFAPTVITTGPEKE